MPFELGLSVLHANRSPDAHTWFLFESVNWRIQKSLSDLNGTDPYIHDGTVEGVFRELALEALEHRPLDVVATQQHFLHVGVNFLLDVFVLADVAVEFNFHGPAKLSQREGETSFLSVNIFETTIARGNRAARHKFNGAV